MHSATTGLSLGAGRHSRSHANRKKKTRVVNLRKPKTTDDLASESGDSESSAAAPASEPIFATRPVPEEPEDVITPPHSPSGRVRFRTSSIDLGDTPRKLRLSASARPILNLSSTTVPEQVILDPTESIEKDEPTMPIYSHSHRPSYVPSSFPAEKGSALTRTPYLEPTTILHTGPGILEQAWIMKMAGEIARRAHDQKNTTEGFWSNADGREDTPPPAYQPKA